MSWLTEIPQEYHRIILDNNSRVFNMFIRTYYEKKYKGERVDFNDLLQAMEQVWGDYWSIANEDELWETE